MVKESTQPQPPRLLLDNVSEGYVIGTSYHGRDMYLFRSQLGLVWASIKVDETPYVHNGTDKERILARADREHWTIQPKFTQRASVDPDDDVMKIEGERIPLEISL